MTADTDDPKVIVACGYDVIAERYLAWAMGVRVAERSGYLRIVCDALSESAAVLELGCGAGIPITQRLAERFTVTGVDDDWLGAPMYFSGYDAETNRRLVTDAGLTVEIAQAETDDEFGKPATFFWIVARKPRESDERE
ncbi:MAG: class I SAM-dependent methyltransferase [Thermomicrobia bacterium]|nr:class I SAM-dependent methyltransferase [Thermomicrobia bacterium]